MPWWRNNFKIQNFDGDGDFSLKKFDKEGEGDDDEDTKWEGFSVFVKWFN